MKEAENEQHIWLNIKCPKGGHAAFRVEDEKFICEVCEKDFTYEVFVILDGLIKSLGGKVRPDEA